jgi:putative ABC transport system substrate-binding protein
MSYGINLKDQYRNVGCILKGTKPADLPVMQPTKFEMVINTKIAKELNGTTWDPYPAMSAHRG